MSNKEHILISLQPRHARNIFDGLKHVEFRRRNMHVSPGTTVWIYVKLPIGAITGRAVISCINTSSPSALWKKYGAVSGLSKSEFFSYFKGVKDGVALELADTKELRKPIHLPALRDTLGGFHPPQFFTRLPESNPILKVLKSRP